MFWQPKKVEGSLWNLGSKGISYKENEKPRLNSTGLKRKDKDKEAEFDGLIRRNFYSQYKVTTGEEAGCLSSAHWELYLLS